MLKKAVFCPKTFILGYELDFTLLYQFKPLVIQVSFAVLAGILFQLINIPVPWFLGAIAVGTVYGLTHCYSQPLPSFLSSMGQAIIALATATRFSPQSLSLAHHYFLPLMLFIGITGGMSLLNGYLLGKWTGIEQKTCFLGSIPGSGASIVAMSEEMGADAMTVAILQYVRIFMVACLIPLLMSILYGSHKINGLNILLPNSPSLSLPIGLNLFILILCGWLGVWGGKRLKLPSSLFLGPFLVGLACFWLLPRPIYVPQPLFIVGLLLLGLSIGLKFDRQRVKTLFKAVLIEIFLVGCLILACFGAGYTFHLITGVDPMTAILGSTPGGTSAMMATVLNLGGDAGLVMAMQMTRMLLILLLIPFFANVLTPDLTSKS